MTRSSGEWPVVARTETPRTRYSIAEDLRGLGLSPGDTVIVHSSLSSLGWVNGGAVAVVQALVDVVAESGTIVMPAHSAGGDPARWQNPPVPESWVETIRQTVPPFDPRVTPSRNMGAIVEVFRTWPGSIRSHHPLNSFAAWGHAANEVVEDQPLALSMGEGSPLAAVYDRDGKVLLLGVGYDSCTSLHLAEYRITDTPIEVTSAPVPAGDSVDWQQVDEISFMDDDWLREIGDAFEAAGAVNVGRVGSAESRLFSQRAAVDFAVDWLHSRYAGM